MNKISHIFKNIGEFLNNAAAYQDERIKTGLFIGDIKKLNKITQNEVESFSETKSKEITNSSSYKNGLKYFKRICIFLLSLPLIGPILKLCIETFLLLTRYYAEFFIVFALTFPAAILFLNVFESSPRIFFLTLPLFILYFTYCNTALFYCIYKAIHNEKISIWTSFISLRRLFPPVAFVVLTQLAIVLEVIIGFFACAVIYTYIFSFFTPAWSNSLLYWFFITTIGIFTCVVIFLVNITMHQAYFIVLFEKKSLYQAYKNAWKLVRKNQPLFIFNYLLVNIFLSILLYWAALYYLYIGIAIILFFSINYNLFLGFILQKNLGKTDNSPANPTSLFTILMFFGIINYLLLSILVTKHLSNFTAAIQNQRDTYFLSREAQAYTNSAYHYSVSYPQGWSLYEWQPDYITLYNNYTGTTSGGVWLNIRVQNIDADKFTLLSNAPAGIIKNDTDSGDIIVKISNEQVQTNEAIKYTYYKAKMPYPEFQTHYLIKKDNLQYDVWFATLNKYVEIGNGDLFESIIKSFKFIK